MKVLSGLNVGTPKKLAAVTALTTSAATIWTSSGVNIVTEIILSMVTNATNRSAHVNFVPSGGSAATGNLVIPDVVLPPNSITIIELNTVFENGDFISALASANSAVNIMISGALSA